MTTATWPRENANLVSLLTEELHPGEVFMDVGANEGIFAIPAARHVGVEGRVLAFEPAPDMALLLRNRTTAAGLEERVSVYEVALGLAEGTHALRADKEHPTDSTKRSLFVDGPAIAQVRVRAFDKMVESGEIVLNRGLHAVKIDVEGAELPVLKGMARTIRTQMPRMIVVETIEGHMRRAGYAMPALIAFLRGLAYVPLDMPDGRLDFDTVFVPKPAVP